MASSTCVVNGAATNGAEEKTAAETSLFNLADEELGSFDVETATDFADDVDDEDDYDMHDDEMGFDVVCNLGDTALQVICRAPATDDWSAGPCYANSVYIDWTLEVLQARHWACLMRDKVRDVDEGIPLKS